MEYVENDFVMIAKRENNNRRGYLVVNPLQGKHIPVSPGKALSLFTSLAEILKREYLNERLLLIGFAETATAIGAQAAISLGTDYIQTTREVIPDVDYLFFSEEHSHATEQKLVKDDIDAAVASGIDRIVFVEDEVTTGKTILNIISILEKVYPNNLKFSVASLLNGMSEENLRIYARKGIRLHYLVKSDHSTYSDKAELFAGNGNYYECITQKTYDISQLPITELLNARRLVRASDYEMACDRLWREIRRSVGQITGKNILVVGTEEFMYPALYVGSKFEELGNSVLCHSTTRSPIIVSMEDGYPLHNRYELMSLYDCERRTFLYDIDKYERVFIVTDAPETETKGLNTLINALCIHNRNVTLVRWC